MAFFVLFSGYTSGVWRPSVKIMCKINTASGFVCAFYSFRCVSRLSVMMFVLFVSALKIIVYRELLTSINNTSSCKFPHSKYNNALKKRKKDCMRSHSCHRNVLFSRNPDTRADGSMEAV